MKKIKRLLFSVFILFIFSISPGFCQDYGIAVDFNLKDLSGNEIKLSDFRDKQPLILFFWATWCPVCRKQIPLLNKMYPDFKKDGIEVLGIDVEESKEKVERFLKNYPLNIKVILDPDGKVASDYKIIGVPTYFLIDKKGNIVSQDNSFPQEKYKELLSK